MVEHIVSVALLIVYIYICGQALAEKAIGGFGAVPNVIDLIHVDNYLHTFMRFSLFDQWGARNSPPIWHALRTGLDRLGLTHRSHDPDADVAVIWSLVWSGRMRSNHTVWQQFRSTGRPVIVLEVGSLVRGITWKLGVNGLGSGAYWGTGRDPNRARTLRLNLMPWHDQGRDVLIAVQRQDSEQWAGQPVMSDWLDQLVRDLRKVTDRTIKVRVHPRQGMTVPANCVLERPRAVANTYDDFDFDSAASSAWCVINWNSGAGVRAAMLGTPVFVHSSSLAAAVGNVDWSQIEQPARPPRDQWLDQISHTEWTREEIASGHPITRLMSGLESL